MYQLKNRTSCTAFAFGLALMAQAQAGTPVSFVFTADPLFGINRGVFHEDKAIDARYANREMVEKINTLPGITFPNDGELQAGQSISGIDFVVVGGNIGSRSEVTGIIQSAEDSWKDFQKVYVDGLQVKDHNGLRAPLFVEPGNQDVSNAIGYYKKMEPAKDPSVLVGIYNAMMNPAAPLTSKNFDVAVNKIHYSRDVGGIHLVFVNVWPDSAERAWMETDLANRPAGSPVILFSNVSPDVATSLLTNPNGKHDINKDDKFENVIPEVFQGGTKVDDKSTIHERALAVFVKKHPEIKAYFHGNQAVSDLKVWLGPDADFLLPTFSADSPVKGTISAKQEELVSFFVATVDVDAKQLTVRECFWNKEPKQKHGPLAWGNHTTFDFRAEETTPAPEPTPSPEPTPTVTDSVSGNGQPVVP